MSEKEKLAHLMKGVTQSAFQLLVAKNSCTVDDFYNACKTFEKAQRSCLGKPVYNILSNVALSFSLSTTDIFDVCVLIRETVRRVL